MTLSLFTRRPADSAGHFWTTYLVGISLNSWRVALAWITDLDVSFSGWWHCGAIVCEDPSHRQWHLRLGRLALGLGHKPNSTKIP